MKASHVPTIDFALAKTDPDQLEQLDSACRDHGFFLLKNHGIQSAINAMWKASEWFFEQPREDKLAISRTESIPLGYYDRELTKQKRNLKEVFDYMKPKIDGDDFNQWPEDKDFKNVMERFFKEASVVAEETLNLGYHALNNSHIKF